MAIGASALTAPLASFAQQKKADSPTRIGFLPLGSSSSTYDQSQVEAFRQGLRENGLIENRHITIDLLWVSDEAEYPRAVSELLQRGARLLVPAGTSASVAAKRQASTIPIVFITVGDPIGVGLVESLSRPGGNATGFSDILLDLSGKYVDLARELGKPPAPINYLWYTGWANGQHRFQATERAAQSAGVKLRSRGISDIARSERCPGHNEEGWCGDGHHPTQPVHVPATQSADRIRDESGSRDDICVAGSGE